MRVDLLSLLPRGPPWGSGGTPRQRRGRPTADEEARARQAPRGGRGGVSELKVAVSAALWPLQAVPTPVVAAREELLRMVMTMIPTYVPLATTLYRDYRRCLRREPSSWPNCAPAVETAHTWVPALATGIPLPRPWRSPGPPTARTTGVLETRRDLWTVVRPRGSADTRGPMASSGRCDVAPNVDLSAACMTNSSARNWPAASRATPDVAPKRNSGTGTPLVAGVAAAARSLAWATTAPLVGRPAGPLPLRRLRPAPSRVLLRRSLRLSATVFPKSPRWRFLCGAASSGSGGTRSMHRLE